jgi:hypothetical protein
VVTPLITLASVAQWLATAGTGDPWPPDDNPLLERMIGSASAFVVQYISRPIAPATFVELYDGAGRRSITLRQQPVVAVRSLADGLTVLTPRTVQGGSGYVFDSTSVSLVFCAVFCHGQQNVQVTYDAGFQTSDALVVPANAMLDSTELSSPWNTDRGVAYASGAAFTAVSVTPTMAGTYQPMGADPFYRFASADVGASIVVTYGFTPDDIAQACIELVGEMYKSRSRIGEVSRGLAQQPATFSQRDMNARIKTMLAPYRQVVPIP